MRASGLVVVVVVVSVAVMFVACGLDVSGNAPPPAADGGSVVSGAEAGETNDDGGGGVSTTDTGAAAAQTFCDGVQATFCADFDDVEVWEPTKLDAGASVGRSTTTYLSPPRSLHATSTNGNPAALAKSFTMTSSLEVEFDVRYAFIPSAGYLSPVLITPPTYPGFDIHYFTDSVHAYFQQFGDDVTDWLPVPPANTWHHVSIKITAGTTITAAADGKAGWTSHTLKYPWSLPTTVTVHVGVARAGSGATGDVLVDNVVIRVQ